MHRHRINRRTFFRWSALTGGSVLLAACGAAAPATDQPTAVGAGVPAASTAAPAMDGGNITLNVLWENWGDIYNGLMKVVGENFTKENPSIKLEWNFDPDWVTKLTTLVAAQMQPDVTLMRPAPLANFAAKNTLVELDEQVKIAGVQREDFVTPLWDSGFFNGKQYALPGGADFWCLFYSKDVYREVGLDPEKPPTTFDELIEHSQEILQRDAAGDIQRIGYNPSAAWFVNWAYIFGGKFYDEASGKITANDPANVEALARLQAYVKYLDVNKLAAFNQRPGTFEAGNPFSTKQAAFIIDGFWTYEALDQHAPDIDYAVTFWPTLKGTEAERANYVVGGWQVALPAGAKHSDDAWKFLRYGFINKSAEMGYSTLNGPCVKSQFQAWEDGLRAKMGSNNRMAPYLRMFTQTGEFATKFFPIMPVQQFYLDELNRIYDLVMREEMTPQSGLDEVTKNVQTELDKALKG